MVDAENVMIWSVDIILNYQNHWISGLRPSSSTLNTRKHVSETGSDKVFNSRNVVFRSISIPDDGQSPEPSNSECHTTENTSIYSFELIQHNYGIFSSSTVYDRISWQYVVK
jgi:hypothetical protein